MGSARVSIGAGSSRYIRGNRGTGSEDVGRCALQAMVGMRDTKLQGPAKCWSYVRRTYTVGNTAVLAETDKMNSRASIVGVPRSQHGSYEVEIVPCSY